MKILFASLTVLMLAGITSCNRDEVRNDDLTIERQEDYNREDMSERRAMPVESEDEVEIDRDVIGDDEVELND